MFAQHWVHFSPGDLTYFRKAKSEDPVDMMDFPLMVVYLSQLVQDLSINRSWPELQLKITCLMFLSRRLKRLNLVSPCHVRDPQVTWKAPTCVGGERELHLKLYLGYPRFITGKCSRATTSPHHKIESGDLKNGFDELGENRSMNLSTKRFRMVLETPRWVWQSLGDMPIPKNTASTPNQSGFEDCSSSVLDFINTRCHRRFQVPVWFLQALRSEEGQSKILTSTREEFTDLR